MLRLRRSPAFSARTRINGLTAMKKVISGKPEALKPTLNLGEKSTNILMT